MINNPINNKKILLGVSGGIAAYKAAEFCRLLVKQGADVRVVMTDGACEFIQPLTFQALTGNPVYRELFEADAQNAMDHIDLGRWADLVVIAPATANTISHLAHGDAHNLLLTIALATSSKIAVAPAMNMHMMLNESTRDNLRILQQRGVFQWGPAAGDQACGDVGPGRMLEATELLEYVIKQFQPGQLSGKKVMITAGPTREAIDPVRFLSNRSSGKMGYALAQAALEAGAEVTLVSGPVCLSAPAGAHLLPAISCEEMLGQVVSCIHEQDIFIACAAVSDYRVDAIASQKIKKSEDTLTLNLVKNPDILATVATLKNKPFCVGFAAETQQLEQYANNKLTRKNLDMVAANRVDDASSGFEVDDNALSIFWNNGRQDFARDSKTVIARQLVELVAQRYVESNQD